MPEVMPATISPAGGNINAAPILVNSIKEIISKLAYVERFDIDFRKETGLLSQRSILGISTTVAHVCGLLY